MVKWLKCGKAREASRNVLAIVASNLTLHWLVSRITRVVVHHVASELGVKAQGSKNEGHGYSMQRLSMPHYYQISRGQNSAPLLQHQQKSH